jgi:hypothetical protein
MSVLTSEHGDYFRRPYCFELLRAADSGGLSMVNGSRQAPACGDLDVRAGRIGDSRLWGERREQLPSAIPDRTELRLRDR